MRPKLSMRTTRRGRLIAGAMITTIPAAITAGQALAANLAPQTAVPAQVSAHRIAFNHPVVVTGSLSAVDAGHRVQLQFQPAGQTIWQWLATTTVGGQGHYRLAAPLRRSGSVRVVDLSTSGTPVPLVHAREASAPAVGERVTVSAALRVTPRGHGALGGQRLSLSGRLLPGLAGRVVTLESATGSHWTAVARARTSRHGGFALRFAPAYGVHRLRVRFAGDRDNTKAAVGAGTATGFEQTVASWYNDGGTTGCGFHATYGVANKSLPCGTRVTFSYGGRTVVATVDDRGPYVGGRTWDLNQNTAAALGFAGVDTVWDAH
jgi:rare lipoprotein A